MTGFVGRGLTRGGGQRGCEGAGAGAGKIQHTEDTRAAVGAHLWSPSLPRLQVPGLPTGASSLRGKEGFLCPVGLQSWGCICWLLFVLFDG